MADVLNIPVERPCVEEGPAYGAAMLAMVGCGEYESVAQAAEKLVRVSCVTSPDPARAALYAKRYAVFCTLYPALKESFALMNA